MSLSSINYTGRIPPVSKLSLVQLLAMKATWGDDISRTFFPTENHLNCEIKARLKVEIFRLDPVIRS